MSAPSSASPKILVVDDEPDVRKFVKMRLEAAGYEVHLAENGETALLLTQNIHPDLILLDIKLPLYDGYEVLRRIRADPALSHIPIVLATADASVRIKEGSRLMDANNYIMKPFDAAEMLKIIARELRNKDADGQPPRPVA